MKTLSKTTSTMKIASRSVARRRTGATTITAALKDNMLRLSATFPPDSMSKVIVTLPGDAAAASITIPNADGKRASLVFYAALAAKNGGVVGPTEAAAGLALYDEVVAEAREHRGSHPNIDLLLDVQSGAIGSLKVEVVKA
jgi:hypothetical protein